MSSIVCRLRVKSSAIAVELLFVCVTERVAGFLPLIFGDCQVSVPPLHQLAILLLGFDFGGMDSGGDFDSRLHDGLLQVGNEAERLALRKGRAICREAMATMMGVSTPAATRPARESPIFPTGKTLPARPPPA